MARAARAPVGSRGRRRRGALSAAGRGPGSTHGRTARAPPCRVRVHQRSWSAGEADGAPSGLGCDVLRAEECVVDRVGGRRCAGARRAPGERRRSRSTNSSDTCRRASAIIRPRPPASGSRRGSSTTAPGPSTATRRPNSTPTSSSSTSRARRTATRRPLQPRELYKSQAYVTAVYRAELATRLKALGYDDRARRERPTGDPRLHPGVPGRLESAPAADSGPAREGRPPRGGSRRDRGASDPRSANGRRLTTRCRRSIERWRRPSAISRPAWCRRRTSAASASSGTRPGSRAHAAVTFAKERNLERDAVVDERAILRDALARSMGEVAFGEIKTEFEQRVDAGEFIGVAQRPGAPGRAFTTREMIDLERETIQSDARGTAHAVGAEPRDDHGPRARPSASERGPTRRGRPDPREPRPDHGAGRRGRRRKDDRPRRRPRRGGA